MPANTNYLDSTPTVFSSVSLNGSGATLNALNAVVGSTLSAGGAVTFGSSLSVAGAVTMQGTQTFASGQTATFNGPVAFRSRTYVSSGTTAQSLVSTKVLDGQFIFSIQSLNTNGMALGLRSGNSVWIFRSSELG